MIKRLAVRYVRPLLENRVYTVQQGLIKGMRRKGGMGFIPYERASEENQFLLSLDLSGQTVFDIGGWEGVFALFFSRKVRGNGQVQVFEPNPINARKIRNNLALNHVANVTLNEKAVGAENHEATLVLEEKFSGMGSLRSERHEFTQNSKTWTVTVTTIDDFVDKSGVFPDFVKIDVEGFEWHVLQGMSQTIEMARPTFFIELHDGFFDDNHRCPLIVPYLLQHGYRIQHLENKTVFTGKELIWPKMGHLYCVHDDKG